MKSYSISLLILLTACFNLAFSQSAFDFGLSMGTPSYDEITDLSIHSNGDVYFSGVFNDSVNLGDNSNPDYVKGGGYRDILIAKYDTDGNKQWAFGLGDIGWDRGWAMALDPQENIYSGGVFSRRVDFDPSPDSSILESNTAGFWPDGYLAKYNSLGELEWAKHLLTARDRSASQSATLLAIHSMHIDPNGDLLIGGAFWDTVYLDPNTMIVSDGPLRDMFLAKYDSDGNLIWGQQMGGAADQEIREISTDDQGNVFTTGYFFGTADFDPSANKAELSSEGAADIFIAKYTSGGAFEWVHGFGSMDAAIVKPESGNGLGVDGQGNVYLTGIFYGEIDFDPGAGESNLSPDGSNGIFTAKYDAQGGFKWAFTLEGAAFSVGKKLSVESNGDFWLAGDFGSGSGMDLDPGPDSSLVYSLGTTDFFIAKYNTQMAFIDGWSIRGLERDEVQALDTHQDEIAVGGLFSRTIILDPTTGDLRFSKGDADMFVLTYGAGATRLDERLPAGSLLAYPNPAEDMLEIKARWTHSQSGSIRLLNLQGQVLKSQNFSSSTELQLPFSVAAYPPGMYLLELRIAQGYAIQKIVIR